MRDLADRALGDALHHVALLEEHAAADLDHQMVIDAVERDRLFGGAWSDMGGCATASPTAISWLTLRSSVRRRLTTSR